MHVPYSESRERIFLTKRATAPKKATRTRRMTGQGTAKATSQQRETGMRCIDNELERETPSQRIQVRLYNKLGDDDSPLLHSTFLPTQTP